MLGAALAGDEEGWQLAPVLGWVFDEARRIADPNDLTSALGERLKEAGAPVTRLRLVMRMLHPLLTAWSAIWERDGGLQRDVVEPHGLESRAIYLHSPMEHVARTGSAYRRRLSDGLSISDHRLLHELANRGATDYLALPLTFTTGSLAAIVIVTDRPSGLDDSDVGKFEILATALSSILETMAAYRLAKVIASAYIGPRAGEKVLQGSIRRGDLEVVRAAIWFSDLRDWSGLSHRLQPTAALALVNAYFEIVEAAVSDVGGEVLKFIGDAVLAIFPVEVDDTVACRTAIDAARAAHRAAAEHHVAVEFGIGLHLGDVIYGNVGAPSRLDFTVMGEAVNLTARLEKLCRKLGRPVVASEPLALASGLDHVDLGSHLLTGWDNPVRALTPV